MTFAEAAMIMMSGEKEDGGGTHYDSRIAQLDATPTLYKDSIGNGWTLQFKLASDVDNYAGLSTKDGYVYSFYTYWTAYYCYYKNIGEGKKEFRFCKIDTQWYTKKIEYYYPPGGPGIDAVFEHSDFTVDTVETTSNGTHMNGTYKETVTYYNYDYSTGPIPVAEIETKTTTKSWSRELPKHIELIGAGDILNGTPNDFKQWFVEITGIPINDKCL